MNSELSPFTKNYVALYRGKPVAFIAVMEVKMRTHYHRVSRLVVLPDYQGVGVGRRLLNFTAEYYTSRTKLPFTIVTSNPQLVRGNLENWRITHAGRCNRMNSRNLPRKYSASSCERLTVSLRYQPKIVKSG
ncbi:GNAT family N-acetyltransferase [Candidatus Bathyarchaeota archaeon]|nr:GNAT family N-acetyltransferase [Candidatus Bathyarchaeota archaeon]